MRTESNHTLYPSHFKMNYKKGLGISLILLGIYIILISATITGAVIGTQKENLLGWLGILTLITGVVFLTSATLEQRARKGPELLSAPYFFERIDARLGEDAVLILDTSAISLYPTKDIETYLGTVGRERVLVPEAVLDEIYSPQSSFIAASRKKLREAVEENSCDEQGYETCLPIARDYLSRSGKSLIKQQLLPYLTGQKLIQSGSDQIRVQEVLRKVKKDLFTRNKGLDFDSLKIVPEYSRQQITSYLENIEVSDADAGVLAMAIHVAKNKERAVIAERDIDLREAVELIKLEDPSIGKYLDIVEPYKRKFEITPDQLKSFQLNRQITETSFAD